MASGSILDSSLDALPYIEYEYGDLKDQVDALIQAEMQTFKPKDYLAERGLLEYKMNLGDAVAVADGLERAGSGVPMQQLDMSRYKIEPPSEEQKEDVGAWQASLARGQTMLEHQSNRLVNVELMQRYSTAAWRKHAENAQGMDQACKVALGALRKEQAAVNLKRKAMQIEAGAKLRSLEEEWWTYTQKNNEVSRAVVNMERDVRRLRAAAVKRGKIAPPESTPQPMVT